LKREVGSLTAASTTAKQFLDGLADVARDLPQECRGDVASSVERHRCSPPVGVSILTMRSTLTYLHESEPFKERHDLAWLEDRDRAGHSGNLDRLNTDELGLELRLAIFQEHLDDLLKVPPQLVQGLALAVRAGPAWDVADVQAGVGIPFDHDAESTHSDTPRVILSCQKSHPVGPTFRITCERLARRVIR
jgi:hypothetical protein